MNTKKVIEFLKNTTHFSSSEKLRKLEFVVLNHDYFSDCYFDVLGNRAVKKVGDDYYDLDYFKRDIFKLIEGLEFYYSLSSEGRKATLLQDITDCFKFADKTSGSEKKKEKKPPVKRCINPLKERIDAGMEARRQEYDERKAKGEELEVERFGKDFLCCIRPYSNEMFLYWLVKIVQTIMHDDKVCMLPSQRKYYIDKFNLVLAQGKNKGKSALVHLLFKSIGADHYIVNVGNINEPSERFFAKTHPYVACCLDDVHYDKSGLAVENLKKMGDPEVLVRELYKDAFTVPHRCSYVICTDNKKLFELDENNVRFMTLIPFEGGQGTPTTGIWDEQYRSEEKRMELFRELWYQAWYLIKYCGLKCFSSESPDFDALIEESQNTIDYLKSLKSIEEVNIVDLDKEDKAKLIEKSVLAVKKRVSEMQWTEILTPEIRSICEEVFETSNIKVDNSVVNEVGHKCGYSKGPHVRRRGLKGYAYITNYKNI